MPSAGSDKNGITAVMNSQVKLKADIHAGSVQNMKFSRGDLENAMKEPEKYRHVFVRVGGFSARFVELDRAVQLEILSRTLH